MADGIGYLTPDLVEFGSVADCRTVTLPLSLWYLVNGALQELTFPENWEMFGTATPEETADFFINVLDKYGKAMPIGSIIALATNGIPDGVLVCDGTSYTRVDYPQLFDVLDPQFIIDADNFITPDLTGRFLLADENGRSLGDVGGEEEHALTITEMPAHSHDYMSAVASVATVVVPDEPSAVSTPSTTSPQGGGNAHNNMPPFYVVKYGIVAK